MDGTYPARTTTNTDHAECRGKPSHDSWLELRFIVPIEPSSVPESGIVQRSEIGMKGSWDVCHLAINRHRHVPDSLRSLNRNSSVGDKLVLMVPSREKNC